MSRSVIFLLSLFVFSVFPSRAETTTPEPPSAGPRLRVPSVFYNPPLDRRPLFHPLPGDGAPSVTPEEPRAFSLMTHSRRHRLDRLYGPRAVELSRFDCALKGAGLGMKIGWIAGCLARTADLWDDRTTWYAAGATAAVGAILGGTVKADDPTWNIRFEWQQEEER